MTTLNVSTVPSVLTDLTENLDTETFRDVIIEDSINVRQVVADVLGIHPDAVTESAINVATDVLDLDVDGSYEIDYINGEHSLQGEPVVRFCYPNDVASVLARFAA